MQAQNDRRRLGVFALNCQDSIPPNMRSFLIGFDGGPVKRRSFIRTLAVAPAAPALLAQQPVAAPVLAPVAAPAAETVRLEVISPEAVGEPVARFFIPSQFAALKKLGDVLMPAMGEALGASDSHAPEFLDFLISQSPAERQQLYRSGLNALNTQARARYNKAFAEVDASQADELLASLREPWTYDPPADPLARFLRQARLDIRQATLNSREYNTAGGRQGVNGLYWHSLDEL